MITKLDWQAASDQLMNDDRRRLGEPPTANEMLAYMRGELTADQEAAVQERFVCYPELVRTLTEPFPSDGASPGDSDFLTDEEFGRHWTLLQTRMQRKQAGGSRVVQLWRWSALAAAIAAIVLGVLLWQTRISMLQPHAVVDEQVLFPDGRRGPSHEPAILTARGESVLLVTPLIGEHNFTAYRLEIVNLESRRVIWTSPALQRRDDDAFAIVVPRRFLRPGNYQIVVYGRGATDERLATYSLRVPAARP